jgi:hypothetical protein
MKEIITSSNSNAEKLGNAIIFAKVLLFENIIVEIYNFKMNELYITT